MFLSQWPDEPFTEETTALSDQESSNSLRQRLQRADPNLTVSAAISIAEQAPGVEIEAIEPESPAEAAGIQPGEKLISINGQGIRDTIDYYFHSADEELELEIENGEGKRRLVSIEKDLPEDSLGIELIQFTTQHCGCNCVFCFVHQLPDNMRKSLYVKDEDYRLGFMQGSYITGVTLKDADLERIATQRLSPLYLSVHAIDEKIRQYLLGIKKARPFVDLLKFFRVHYLLMHTQIVLCPELNDGKVLDQTLDTLLEYYPAVQSIAIVPIGLTKWREGLPQLNSVTPKYARKFIESLTPRLKEIEEKFDEPVALLADEWYLIAGLEPPGYTDFPDIPQLENGVGMVYHFYKDFAQARKALPKSLGKKWRVAALTSTLSPPVLKRLQELCSTCEGLELDIIPIVNTLFGETVHVTGLLTGTDLGKAIKHHPGYDQYLLPGNCLRKYDEKFLDDMTLKELVKDTEALLTPVLGGALDFVETILEHGTGKKHHSAENHVFLEQHWAND